MANLRVEIVSAEEAIWEGEASLVSVSAQMGEVGITPGHTPFITRIKPGEVRVNSADGDGHELDIYVSGGILEVQPDVVTILADTVLRADDIDEAAVQKARDEAEKLLADATPGGEVDFAAVQMQLAEAAAQLQLLKKLKKN